MTAQLEVAELEQTSTDEELNTDDKLYELIDGEYFEMNRGPSSTHGDIIFTLSGYLFAFLTINPLGKGYSGTAFTLNPQNAPIPDVAFVKAERIHLAAINTELAFPETPDLAVEVMSPSDKWAEVVAKVRRYQQASVGLVWVIDPFDQNIYVYKLNKRKKMLFLEDELDGDDVIPGFKLAVKALFE